MPPIDDDYKVRLIIANHKGVAVRVKLLVLALTFKKKIKKVILNGNFITVDSWHIEPKNLS